MTFRGREAALLALGLCAASLGAAPPAPSFLEGLDLERPLARFALPPALREVSGLAIVRDTAGRERLLAHDDERAVVHEIDRGSGRVSGSFAVGRPALEGDFEAIAAAEDGRLYLTTSDGGLVSFRLPGAGQTSVEAEARRETSLGRACEIEGLAVEAGGRTLLFLCKEARERELKRRVALLRFPLDAGGAGSPRVLIPEERVFGGGDRGRPSDLARVPGTGRYVLVDSRERWLAEITPEGEVVSRRRLPSGHRQPEGLAIFSDGQLAVADEAAGGRGGKKALLTIYGPSTAERR